MMNRRQFLAGGIGAAVTAWMASKTARAAAVRKPNVILIYADDVGYGDVGAYGAELIPTPNIDRMAAEGLRFTDAHCAAATCTPSRYSLLTGEMAFRKAGTEVLPGDATMIIAPDQYTLGDLFKQAGYQTGVIGKWHLGLGDGVVNWNAEIRPNPQDIGFDYHFLLPATNDRVPCVYVENGRVLNHDASDPISVAYKAPLAETVPGTAYPDGVPHPEAMTYYPSTHGHNNSVINGIGRIGYMKGGKAAIWDDEVMSDLFVQKAGEFIELHQTEPFFLHFCSQNIHVPRTPNPRFQGKSELTYRGDAMVELDWCVGQILETVTRCGLEDDTLIIFTSDNGPVYDDGYADGTTVQTSTGEVDRGHDGSGPYRGGKYQIYEGGTRIPFVVRWPGRVTPGVTNALVTQVDLVASFAALLGQELPGRAAQDSRDMLDAFLGKDTKGAEIILEHANQLSIRKDHWKYIEPGPRRKKSAAGELFDLANDIGEKQNVLDEHEEVARELSGLLTMYRERGLR